MSKKKRTPRQAHREREREERKAWDQSLDDANKALQALCPGVPLELALIPPPRFTHPKGRSR